MKQHVSEATVPEVLWHPTAVASESNHMQAFRDWLAAERQVHLPDYQALWQWSVTDLAGFWTAVADFFEVRFHTHASDVIVDQQMPETVWFRGATLNYAEHALRAEEGKLDDDLAVIFECEDGLSDAISYGELRAQVGAVRAALVELGVGKGDRVVALAPNIPQTLIAFLATASLGAIWSSCSPDFGVSAVRDRFSQVSPTVLIAVDATTTTASNSTSGRRSPSCRTICRVCGRRSSSTTSGTTTCPRTTAPGEVGTRYWTDTPARRCSSNRSPSTTPCGFCIRRERPVCRRRSCTDTAGCFSNISRP